MSLANRIRIALCVVALVPVLVLGWMAVRGAREELVASVGGAQVRQAAELARGFERLTLDRLRGLRQTASYIPFDRLTRAEASAALAIPYRQSPDLNVLAVLDARGEAVTDYVAHQDPAVDPALQGHEAVDARGLEAFARAVPLQEALSAGLAVGAPYRATASGIPRLVIAVRLATKEVRVLAAELSLAELSGPLHDAAGDGVAFVVASGGGVLSSTASGAVTDEEQGLVADGWKAGPLTRVVRRADGQTWLASFAPVGVLGWGVVVAQPTTVAFRAADHVRRQTEAWAFAALLLAAALGLALPRALTRPVRELTAAAAALRDGRYDTPVPAAGKHELGTLAEAFAHMAAEVRRRDAEIRAWNADLQERVNTRTAELRAAEDQVFRSRRLSALGSLSAGVAHGLNDPLTSVVGLVSMARRTAGADTDTGQMLGTALAEARRMVAVVHDLRRLAAPGLTRGARRFTLDGPVQAAISRFEGAAAERGVRLDVAVEAGMPTMEGDPAQIESLVVRLLENAIASTPPGGRVSVAASCVDGAALRLAIADTGAGIPAELHDRIFDPFFTTSRDPRAGLGLSLAHGIVSAHHGRIQVESGSEQGAMFTVHFPVAAARPATG